MPAMIQQAQASLDRIKAKFGEGASRVDFKTPPRVDIKTGTRDIIWTANSDAIDLEDEVVVPGGADRSYFERNKAIFLDHRYEAEFRIGSLRLPIKQIKNRAGEVTGHIVRGRIADTPLADDLIRAAQVGEAPGSSVGFKPRDRGEPTEEEAKRYTTKGGKAPLSICRTWDWLELSATWMPCNPDCQGSIVSVDDSRIAALDGLVATKGVIRRESAFAFGLSDARPRVVVAVPRPVLRVRMVAPVHKMS